MFGNIALALLFISVAFCRTGSASEQTPEQRRAEAGRQFDLGNFKDAAAAYRLLALAPANSGVEAALDLGRACEALDRLGDANETETLLEAAVQAHPDDWRVLAEAARRRVELPPLGNLTGGEFTRISHWVGTMRNASERDRVQALQLMLRAQALLDARPDAATTREKGEFYRSFADIMARGRLDRAAAWRFTELTDLTVMPDYGDVNSRYDGFAAGAPVNADGSPVFYPLPASWDAAANDGCRWRWLLGRMAAFGLEEESDWTFGQFLLSQFGVQTMDSELFSPANVDVKSLETGPFAVRTLAENETIARLATGLKRFALPNDFNHIAVFRRLAEKRGGAFAARAAAALATVFENRQQYHKALSWWTTILSAKDGSERKEAAGAVARITGKNGQFEASSTFPAGSRPKLSYLFRNGDRLKLTAHRLNEKLLLRDIRAAMRERRDLLDGVTGPLDPEELGRLAVERDLGRYLSEKPAEWEMPLEPPPDHYSRRVFLEMPFEQAGCYLVEAAMVGGNVSRAIMWVSDLALTRKIDFNRQICYVADAVTGQPAGGAIVSFLGQGFRRDRDGGRMETTFSEFAETADADGLILLDAARFGDKNWLISAETDDGRMAFLGFSRIWAETADNGPADRVAAFVISDRPVYRPGQTVDFKVWLGRAAYGKDAAGLAGTAIPVEIRTPMGDVVYKRTLTADAFGGAADSFALEEGAILGSYGITVGDGLGNLAFRVEEYRKPEFEVTVSAPEKALLLGDTASVRVEARYYFGFPVANATVRYKILRSPHNEEWSPAWRWGWLYGRNALRQSAGVDSRMAIWPPRPSAPPEMTAAGEGTLDADGVFRLPLDTLPAKELFGNQDQRYEITVEVTDTSRRTIVGTGRVIAARQPFRIEAWTDRGYYLPGQEMTVSLKAMLPDGKGVAASGQAVLLRLRRGDRGTTSEEEVFSQDAAADADGLASIRLRAGEPGEYRLVFRAKDADGNRAEGAARLLIRGERGGKDGGFFAFQALELLTDRREYQPGDTVKLAVNAENAAGVVLLFPRAERPSTGKPIVLRLEKGSASADFAVERTDQPNFFFEAITIHNGTFHSEIREVFVPPAAKTLQVEVAAKRPDYAPGEKAEFSVRVTDEAGAPVSGQCVVSLYDRAVEYISGGSNVGDIRAFFWDWKRSYAAQNISSLRRRGFTVHKRGDTPWQPIGVFGAIEADWNDDLVPVNGMIQRPRPLMAGAGDARAVRMAAPMAAAMPMPMQEMKQEGYAVADGAALGGGADEGLVQPQLRSEFADTALWLAALETDADGRASFSLAMPENLASWRARTWTMANGTRVGEGETTVETRKNVIVRPQAPRFLTQKDQVILSANLHNRLPRAKTAKVELLLEGGLLAPADGTEMVRSIELAAGGEARVDWLVNALRPGRARVVMRILTDAESDAAETFVPVLLHGARRVEGFGGVLDGDAAETTIALTVPAERLAERSRLEVSFSPSLLPSLLEALPYLLDYPYGCTEQTLNRFLPAVMVRKCLDGMRLTLEDAAKSKTADDPQAAAWRKRFGDLRARYAATPVFDDKELTAIVRRGVDRLGSMQNADGGWGWFSGVNERSWPHTTAVIMHGLLAARELGRTIPPAVLEAGVSWLVKYREGQIDLLRQYVASNGREGKARADDLDAFVAMVLAGQGLFNPDMRDFLYRDRTELSLSGLSLLGLALEREKATNALDIVLQNLRQYLETDASGSSWLKVPANGWRWQDDPIETQAWYLKLLCRVDPKGKTTRGLAKYILQNRKNGGYWRSTRDTAYALEALTEYAAVSGETAPDLTVSVHLDGVKVMERVLKAENLLDDNRFLLEGPAVEGGAHTVRIAVSGRGNLYYGGALDLFSLEDPMRGAGRDVRIERAYYRLTPAESAVSRPGAAGNAVPARTERYRRERLAGPFGPEGAAPAVVKQGDLIETELIIETANDYEYLVFEDMKAAGLEPVEFQSGYTANALGAYVEYRDDKVVFFVRYLPKGKYSLSCRFRAETPGAFSALPVFGGGMYAPELFGSSDEMKVKVVEKGVFE